MYELEIPSGVKVDVAGETVTIKGKLGSAVKHVNSKFVDVKVQGSKLMIKEITEKKLLKKSGFAATALKTQLGDAIVGVEKGVNVKMKV